ncbi:MAG: hypothetical protein AMXMBFR6_09710 [Betaproteobacteria bacterium]|nr:cytochrome-c oxidase, cbb3-type subunit III [Rhodocyclaceae bacterium]
MADFENGFWSIYIAVITVVSIVACAVLLKMNSKRPGAVELGEHVWDESLREWNNPLPRWWSGLFYITLVFAVVYLVVYPGLGAFQGQFGWSSKVQYEAEMDKAKAEYGPIFARYQGQDVKLVAADPEARAMGERLFLTYCAQCHGADARGAKGFPNLTDQDWLYGGAPDHVKASIAEGRNGVMPPMAHLGAEGAKDVAHYVRSLSGLTADSARVARGKDLFQANCAACHGPDGKGNIAIGAPNLTDKVWLYGSAEATIIEGVMKGRNNKMPAHKEFLGDDKVHLLAAYVYGLSMPQSAAK